MRTCGNNTWQLAKMASSSSLSSSTSVGSESNCADPEAESLLQRLRATKPSVLASIISGEFLYVLLYVNDIFEHLFNENN